MEQQPKKAQPGKKPVNTKPVKRAQQAPAKRAPAKKKKKSRALNGVGILLICLAVLMLVLYGLGGFSVRRGSRVPDQEILANVETLKAIENAAPVDLNEEARLKRLQELQARNGIMVSDLAAEQRRILQLEEYTKADFARWFSNSAIVGDSLTMAIEEYKWLSAPPVYAKIGISVSDQLKLLDSVEIANPEVIFLCFGMNDIEAYRADVSKFIDKYTACIRRLQQNLPNAVIYVNSVFPVSEKTLQKKSYFGYVDTYNDELQAMCRQLGAYYIDSTFLPREDPSLYDADGMHMKSKFYPLWLTYLADVSGLSNDDE